MTGDHERSAALGDGVYCVADVDLRVDVEDWPWAMARRAQVLAHFERKRAANPAYFNGQTFILAAHSLAANVFRASYAPADFASYLFWRDAGFPENGVRDGFGSAILRSAEGHVLLGRQAAGNVNAGSAYLPGGFIDRQDVRADGRIDIDGSVMREIEEETGLDPGRLDRVAGYRLSCAGPLISIGIEFRSRQGSEEMRAAVLAHLAQEAKPELVDIVVIRRPGDLAGANVPDYTRRAVMALLAARTTAVGENGHPPGVGAPEPPGSAR